MLTKLKLLALLGVVGGAALVPLYGDPRTTPVSHPEWARMLLRALEMDQAVLQTASASQAFAVLSWKNTLSFPADRYLRSEGVKIVEDALEPRVTALEAEGEVAYPLSVVTSGDYRLRVLMSGNPANPATAEIVRLGETKPERVFTLVPASLMGWVEGGVVHLDRGAYTAVLRLPAGSAMEKIEVAPPCVSAVEPIGGWQPGATASTEDVAVTGVKALDRESELPPAASPIEIGASSFTAEPSATSVASLGPAAGLEGLWLKAGPGGLRAVVFFELPEAGLYTISVFGIEGAGQSWVADACRKAIVCRPADPLAAREPKWGILMTAPFTAGRHFFTVILGDGAAIQRLRAERKKETAADYVDTLKRLGFDVGSSGPITRARAVDAMRFIQSRAKELLDPACGDVVMPPSLVAGLEAPANIPGPQQPPLQSGGPPPFGAPGAPFPGPTLPPLTTSSPTPPPPSEPPPSTPPTTPPASPPPPTTTPTPSIPPSDAPPTLVLPPSPSPGP